MLILTHCRRKLGFLIAAKSMKRKIVGWFANKLNAIPITRANDEVFSGKGSVTVIGNNVKGKDTVFTSDFKSGYKIILPGYENGLQIESIVNDTELVLSKPIPEEFNDIPFKVLPKLDYGDVYDEVWKRLGYGEAIGIFPEGGSHDRTELLELKAGVTLMALGAMEKYNREVKIVPCGLNYFSGHRFRSVVVIEFGKPYTIPSELVELYKHDKRKACSQLLDKTLELMRSVTLNAPDYESMRVIHTARKLYIPSNIKLSSEKYMELCRRFATGYYKFHDHEELKVWFNRIKAYLKKLDLLGINDSTVATEDNVQSTLNFLGLLSLRFFAFLFLILISGPGIILNIPIGIIAKVISKREAKKAKSKSNVKIHGNDVIASFKLIIGLVVTPILYSTYALIIWYYLGLIYGFLFLMVWPILSYTSLCVVEEGVHIWKSLRTLLNTKWSGKELQSIRKEREEIQKIVRECVDRFGPMLGKEVWENRIVTQEDIDNEKENKKDKSKNTYSIRQRVKYFVPKNEVLKLTENIIDEDIEDLEKDLMQADQHM